MSVRLTRILRYGHESSRLGSYVRFLRDIVASLASASQPNIAVRREFGHAVTLIYRTLVKWVELEISNLNMLSRRVCVIKFQGLSGSG